MYPENGWTKLTDPMLYQRTDENAVQFFAGRVELILHTCNLNEYWAALEKLTPPTKEDDSIIQNHLIIYPKPGSVIGCFAGHKAAVVWTGQGNECRGDLREALTKSFPKARVIIGAGIAYASDQKYKLADVLISNQIENSAQTKILDGKITNRGAREPVGPNVKKIFENPAKIWSGRKHFTCAVYDQPPINHRSSVAQIGCIVSAPTLVSDENLRKQLLRNTPYAVGGEMEGWVLLELKAELKQEFSKEIEVIIIKGVADYGDHGKRDEWQWTAAKAAMDCIHYCLKRTHDIGKETCRWVY